MSVPANRSGRGLAALLLVLSLILPGGCQLPGQHSERMSADSPHVVLERCARAMEAMHFKVKAVDRAHLVVIGEGRIEGRLRFHDVRLSISVAHESGNLYEVKAIATADGAGIRAGAERKARRLFFEELEKVGGVQT